MESLLKVSGCVFAELIPGQEYLAENKTFEWKLQEFTQDNMKVKFEFDQPEIISIDMFDSVKVSF